MTAQLTAPHRTAGDPTDTAATTLTASASTPRPVLGPEEGDHLGVVDGPGGPVARVRWVLDPDDTYSCVQALLGLHDPEAGVLVCLAAPGSPWPVLARHLLLALGKDRGALDATGPRHGVPDLLATWLRAERVRHVVVLRAHLLPRATLDHLTRRATAAGADVWLVAHGAAPSDDGRAASATSIHWTAAFALLDVARAATRPGPADAGQTYGLVRDLARRAGRAWRLYTERTLVRPRTISPGCQLGVLLQNLTIDAGDPAELELRLHAARTGMRDAGLHLTLPDPEPRLLRYLGPRFTPDTITRLRRVACPVAAGALTLALATEADAPWLAVTRLGWTHPRGHHVRAYTGTFRIPPQARPMLRALLADHAAHADPPEALLVDRDGVQLHGRRIAHLVDAAADLAGLPRPPAARACETRYTAENFATPFTGATSLHPTSTADRPP